MNAKEFEKEVLFALDNLTDQEIERIKNEVGVNTDYEIDEDGFTYIVKKSLDISKNNDPYTFLNDLEKMTDNDKPNYHKKYNLKYDSKVKTKEINFEESNRSSENVDLYIYNKCDQTYEANNIIKNDAVRKAA